jgi:hypothetical protein
MMKTCYGLISAVFISGPYICLILWKETGNQLTNLRGLGQLGRIQATGGVAKSTKTSIECLGRVAHGSQGCLPIQRPKAKNSTWFMGVMAVRLDLVLLPYLKGNIQLQSADLVNKHMHQR